jgi:hypothetical protein
MGTGLHQDHPGGGGEGGGGEEERGAGGEQCFSPSSANPADASQDTGTRTR